MLRRYDAVIFDLLTALLDSWTLWNNVAGDEEIGMRWRAAYLQNTYRVGAYRPYETLVADAAAEVGLNRRSADLLASRYSDLRPWPGVTAALESLASAGIPIGIATNCSETLGGIAAACVGVPFQAVVTAERAGFYKPNPRPYGLAISELGATPERCLFVAGSAYDLIGAAHAGLKTWWHDRIGMHKPPNAPDPLRHTQNLEGIADFVLGN